MPIRAALDSNQRGRLDLAWPARSCVAGSTRRDRRQRSVRLVRPEDDDAEVESSYGGLQGQPDGQPARSTLLPLDQHRPTSGDCVEHPRQISAVFRPHQERRSVGEAEPAGPRERAGRHSPDGDATADQVFDANREQGGQASHSLVVGLHGTSVAANPTHVTHATAVALRERATADRCWVRVRRSATPHGRHSRRSVVGDVEVRRPGQAWCLLRPAQHQSVRRRRMRRSSCRSSSSKMAETSPSNGSRCLRVCHQS